MIYKESEFGKIPEHWNIHSTFDYCKIITDYVANGSFKSLADNVNYNQGEKHAVLIRLTDYHNGFKGEFVHIDKKAYDFLGKTKLYGGEIIIANVGANVGTVFLVPRLKVKMSLGPNSIMIKTKGNDKFYYYWFKSIMGQGSLQSIITGSAQPKFNKTAFRKLNVPVPPISEQNAIAQILSSLDDKIELNNKINKNLEELAQTLYKRWFVDFEFPNEDGEPYKSSGGEMVDSDLGQIPIGWKVIKLSNILKFFNGFAFKSKDYAEDGNFKVITIRNVKDGFFDLANVSKVVDVPGKIREDQILSIGDILISLTGNVGRVAIVDEKNCLLNQRVAKISSKVEYKGLVYTLLRNENIFNKVLSLGKGSAQQNLSPVEMSNIEIVFPKNINKEFLEQLNNIYLTLINNSIQNKKLAETRDLLLPKLMSGEIRIPLKE